MYHKHFNLKIYLNYRRSCTKVTKNEWNRSRLCYRKSCALGLPCTTKKVYNGCFNFFSSTFSWAYKPTHFLKFYENVYVLACYISDLSSSNTCPNWKWSRYFFQVTINYKNYSPLKLLLGSTTNQEHFHRTTIFAQSDLWNQHFHLYALRGRGEEGATRVVIARLWENWTTPDVLYLCNK